MKTILVLIVGKNKFSPNVISRPVDQISASSNMQMRVEISSICQNFNTHVRIGSYAQSSQPAFLHRLISVHFPNLFRLDNFNIEREDWSYFGDALAGS